MKLTYLIEKRFFKSYAKIDSAKIDSVRYIAVSGIFDSYRLIDLLCHIPA